MVLAFPTLGREDVPNLGRRKEPSTILEVIEKLKCLENWNFSKIRKEVQALIYNRGGEIWDQYNANWTSIAQLIDALQL